MVIRNSNIIPEMRIAFFRCYVCKNEETVEIDRGRITEPTLCQKCNTKFSFSLIHNRSVFSDKQLLKLQESPGMLSFWSHREMCSSKYDFLIQKYMACVMYCIFKALTVALFH